MGAAIMLGAGVAAGAPALNTRRRQAWVSGEQEAQLARKRKPRKGARVVTSSPD